MRYMHTKLPEFIEKMESANHKHNPDSPLVLRGLENLRSAKIQSLRTGRLEHAVEELAMLEDVRRIEMAVMPRVPETMHTVVIKALREDGSTRKAILDTVNILHPTEEAELLDCEEIEDRRPDIGKH